MRLEGCDDAQRRGKTADCVCHKAEGCGQAEAAVAGGSKRAAASASVRPSCIQQVAEVPSRAAARVCGVRVAARWARMAAARAAARAVAISISVGEGGGEGGVQILRWPEAASFGGVRPMVAQRAVP